MEKNKKKPETVSLSVRIPKTDLDQIRQLAAEDGRTLNNYICMIVRNYLKNIDNSDN